MLVIIAICPRKFPDFYSNTIGDNFQNYFLVRDKYTKIENYKKLDHLWLLSKLCNHPIQYLNQICNKKFFFFFWYYKEMNFSWSSSIWEKLHTNLLLKYQQMLKVQLVGTLKIICRKTSQIIKGTKSNSVWRSTVQAVNSLFPIFIVTFV